MKTKVGICYRDWLHKEFLPEIFDYVEVIEIMPDTTSLEDIVYITTEAKKRGIDISLHCLKSSLGSPEGLNIDAVEKYYFISKFCNSTYFSDHIAFSHVHDTYLSTVQPIEYTEDSLLTIISNLNRLDELFNSKILIENITQNTLLCNSTYTESEFFQKIISGTSDNIKTLFDLTNMYVTAKNNSIPFESYISNFPLNSIETIHVSGYEKNGNSYRDSHTEGISKEQLDVLSTILKKVSPRYILVERDFNVFNFSDIKEDLDALNNCVSQFKFTTN